MKYYIVSFRLEGDIKKKLIKAKSKEQCIAKFKFMKPKVIVINVEEKR